MSPLRQSIALILFLAVTFAAAGIGSLATTPNIPTWYAALAKPSWNPPNWIFGPVWTTLYISMAVAAWLIWRKGNCGLACSLRHAIGSECGVAVDVLRLPRPWGRIHLNRRPFPDHLGNNHRVLA